MRDTKPCAHTHTHTPPYTDTHNQKVYNVSNNSYMTIAIAMQCNCIGSIAMVFLLYDNVELIQREVWDELST